MKRFLSFLIVLCMVMAFTPTLGLTAAADVANVIKGRDKIIISEDSYGPGSHDIVAVGDADVVRMPALESYLDEYSFMYIDAPKKHSVYTLKDYEWLSGGKCNMPFAYHGSRVIVLAVENDYACCLYMTDENKMHAAWIDVDHLSSTFPGKSFIAGSYDRSIDYYSAGYPEIKWSSLPFVDTDTKYTEIVSHNGLRRECDGISIHYHVIGRDNKKDCAGEREIYINDGSGWEYVGSFDLEPYNVPVELNIFFDEPIDVRAVATVPVDRKLEGFTFIQYISDLYYKE